MKILHALQGLGLFLIFVSCQNNVLEKDTISSLSDSTSVSGLTGDSVKLVKSASLHFKVKDVTQSLKAISNIAAASGGMIYHQSLQSVEGEKKELKIAPDSLLVISTYTPEAEITARIPSPQLENFLFQIADLGYFIPSSQMDIDDKSLLYLENVLLQKSRIEPSNSYAGKNGGRYIAQSLALKDQMTGWDITNRAIDADAKYSTVKLRLFQNTMVRKEVIANYNISDYQLSFGKRMGAALQEGWMAFLNFLILIGHLWMFIAVAILSWLAYAYWLQKKKTATPGKICGNS